MHIKICALLLLSSLVVSTSASGEDTKTIERRLNAKLRNGLVVLRNPLLGKVLKFGVDGQSQNKSGIRGFDDEFQVTSVELHKDKIVLKGVRFNDVYDPAKKAVSLSSVSEQLEIDIAITDPTDEVAVARVFHRVALSNKEVSEHSCSELGYLQKIYENAVKHEGIFEVGKAKSANKENTEVCFPSGSRAWRLSDDPANSFAKAIKERDPDYPDAERAARREGGAEFLLRVDETGRVTDGIVLRASTAGFARTSTETFNTWRFKPGTKDGVPVATVLTVEMHFGMGF